MGRELERKLAKRAKAMQKSLKQPKSDIKTIKCSDLSLMPDPNLFDYSDKVVEWNINVVEDESQEAIERIRQIIAAAKSNIYRGPGWSSQRLADLLGLTGEDAPAIIRIQCE